jgi:hypothetical protein
VGLTGLVSRPTLEGGEGTAALETYSAAAQPETTVATKRRAVKQTAARRAGTRR